MHSSLQPGSLRRGLVAAMVLVGVSACSRPDRATTGDDAPQTGAATPSADTQSSDTLSASRSTGTANAPAAATAQDTGQQGQDVSGYQPMKRDTSSDAASPEAASRDTVTVGDSAQGGKTGERLQPSEASGEANADTLADQAQSERVRPPEDSSETQGTVTTDSAAGQTMSRDTASDLGQVDTSTSQHSDTVAVAEADTTAVSAQVDASMQQDTLAQGSPDTAAIQVHVDTTTDQAPSEVAVETQSDTAVVVGDSTQVARTGERLEPNAADAEANADTLATTETERVRPPEDSTEVLGDVNTTDSVAVTTEADTEVHADAAAPNPDLQAVGDANAESVGAARVESTGGIATGEAAVSAMTRAGQRCIVLDPEQSADVRWDLASSPAGLNPCGTGTMTLPRIWTGER